MGIQSGKSVESVPKKKRKATVGRICRSLGREQARTLDGRPNYRRRRTVPAADHLSLYFRFRLGRAAVSDTRTV